MGPISMTLDAALSDVTGALGADFAPGQKHVLGTRVDFAQSSSDDTIAYVATATPPTGFSAGDVYSGVDYGNLVNINTLVAAGSIEAVVKPKDTSGQTWIYIQAGADIDRGEAVMWDATAVDATTGFPVLSGILATSAARVIGVAQWNIPSGSFGWILAFGVGKVLGGTLGTVVNTNMEITPAGAAEQVTAVSDVNYGLALETAAVGVLAWALIVAPA